MYPNYHSRNTSFVSFFFYLQPCDTHTLDSVMTLGFFGLEILIDPGQRVDREVSRVWGTTVKVECF
jgi:hypothetical protein